MKPEAIAVIEFTAKLKSEFKDHPDRNKIIGYATGLFCLQMDKVVRGIEMRIKNLDDISGQLNVDYVEKEMTDSERKNISEYDMKASFARGELQEVIKTINSQS